MALELARRFVQFFAGSIRLSHCEVPNFLLFDVGFKSATKRNRKKLKVVQRIAEAPIMQPCEAAARWPIPAIDNCPGFSALLGIDLSQLDWFADLNQYMKKPNVRAQLRHYHYRILVNDGETFASLKRQNHD